VDRTVSVDKMSQSMRNISQLISVAEEREFLRQFFGSDNRVQAIKNIRESYGCGLSEAVDRLDSFLTDVGVDPRVTKSPVAWIDPWDAGAKSMVILSNSREEVVGPQYDRPIPMFVDEHPGFDDVTPRNITEHESLNPRKRRNS